MLKKLTKVARCMQRTSLPLTRCMLCTCAKRVANTQVQTWFWTIPRIWCAHVRRPCAHMASGIASPRRTCPDRIPARHVQTRLFAKSRDLAGLAGILCGTWSEAPDSRFAGLAGFRGFGAKCAETCRIAKSCDSADFCRFCRISTFCEKLRFCRFGAKLVSGPEKVVRTCQTWIPGAIYRPLSIATSVENDWANGGPFSRSPLTLPLETIDFWKKSAIHKNAQNCRKRYIFFLYPQKSLKKCIFLPSEKWFLPSSATRRSYGTQHIFVDFFQGRNCHPDTKVGTLDAKSRIVRIVKNFDFFRFFRFFAILRKSENFRFFSIFCGLACTLHKPPESQLFATFRDFADFADFVDFCKFSDFSGFRKNLNFSSFGSRSWHVQNLAARTCLQVRHVWHSRHEFEVSKSCNFCVHAASESWSFRVVSGLLLLEFVLAIFSNFWDVKKLKKYISLATTTLVTAG